MSVTTKCAILAFAAFVFVPTFARAESLTPLVTDVYINPGESAAIDVVLSNDQDSEMTFDVLPVKVDLGNEANDLQFSQLDAEHQSWIQFEQNVVTVPARGEVTAHVVLTPSADALDQEFVFGIEFLEKKPSNSQVGISKGYVSLVFATIGSDIPSSFSLIDFSEEQGTDHSNRTFSVTIQNHGERIGQPNGTIEITNIFGKTVAALNLNPEYRRIPSGQFRTFLVDWSRSSSIPLIGIFHVKLRAVPWSHGDELTDELTIVSFPPIAVGVSIVVVLVAFIFIVKYLQRFKRSV